MINCYCISNKFETVLFLVLWFFVSGSLGESFLWNAGINILQGLITVTLCQNKFEGRFDQLNVSHLNLKTSHYIIVNFSTC
ncbi:hypothetical protein SAMN02745131_01621 [Flavisolibacter ginsengisoli DSM 18119]|jgi:hypothetical protein|uniref:Uncharacterized protein n=1 Tax=Flavisolibacter ginsengisoli DSM 18119 TaxID=1121884 RepID=A0A1M4Y6T0_9BACT|nr:hypothetical protein SAMN02745131_01621 [Flavisolibacter ginsengisoli DSM 18119]